jgi:GGDEF domain-containing protein
MAGLGRGTDPSVETVLEVIREFEAFGGASQELVAWELDLDLADLAETWLQVRDQNLIWPAGRELSSGELAWRLTAAGWARLGIGAEAEGLRVDLIESTGVLRRVGDPALSALTRLGSFVMGGCACAVHIFDERYQRRVAATHAPLGEHPSHEALCRMVVDSGQPVICEDISVDPRFADGGFVYGERPVRFYVSLPLRIANEEIVIGTLCAFDHERRTADDEQLARFDDVALQARAQLELWRKLVELDSLRVRDPLTGALNRHALVERVARAMRRRARLGGAVMLISVVVENLQEVNRRHGASAGDALLAGVAGALAALAGPDDALLRLEGGRLVLAAEIDAGGGEERAQELVRLVRDALRRPVASAEGQQPAAVATVGTKVLTAEDDPALALAEIEEAPPRGADENAGA